MTASQSPSPHTNPWELVREAQRAAIARGESRLAEILSMVLEHRQGPLDREQRVPGTFVILPRTFFYELEKALAEIAADAEEHARKERQKQIKEKGCAEWPSAVPLAVQIRDALVRHGRNSGVY